jgi:hypothetical protein
MVSITLAEAHLVPQGSPCFWRKSVRPLRGL